MKRLSVFFSAVMAGVSIAFGGTVFLALENKLAGAALFTVGLFTVCEQGLHLFTGKVCYACRRDRGYRLDLPVVWLGNLAGAALVARTVALTRLAQLSGKAQILCGVKTADSLLSLFILGILCNVFIFIAVDGFSTIQRETGKYLALFFGIMVFIVCGFEHCVADMYYFFLAGAWSPRAVLCLLTITAGNVCGGILSCEAFAKLRQNRA